MRELYHFRLTPVMCISEEDEVFTVVYVYSTGDVLLIIDGVRGMIQAKAVKNFWLKSEDGQEFLGIDFGHNSWILGRVKDKDSALAWINRVNLLYSQLAVNHTKEKNDGTEKE